MLYHKVIMALVSFTFSGVTVIAAQPSCSKYIVESAGNELSFNSYLFQDFRGLSGSSASASSSDTSDGVATGTYEVPTSSHKQPTAAMESYFQNISHLWLVSTWDRMNSPVPMENTASNVFIDYDPTTPYSRDTMLSITTSRGTNGIQLAGELQSVFELSYGSIRFQSRVTGASGACAGMFLYHDDNNESDFEFLTREGSDYVHMTNQPGNKNGVPVPGATTNLSLIYPYSEWNNYRIDWSPGMTRYFINEEIVANKTVNVSPSAMYWMMNIWSDGTSWPGVMAVGGSARLDVRWLQIVYNSTSAPPAGGNVVCVVE